MPPWFKPYKYLGETWHSWCLGGSFITFHGPNQSATSPGRFAVGPRLIVHSGSESRNACPYRFDVTRTNVDHLTFGKGSPHVCLGNALARMEIRLLFTELIPRLTSIELNGEVKRVRSNFINGIKKFPVRVVAK